MENFLIVAEPQHAEPTSQICLAARDGDLERMQNILVTGVSPNEVIGFLQAITSALIICICLVSCFGVCFTELSSGGSICSFALFIHIGSAFTFSRWTTPQAMVHCTTLRRGRAVRTSTA